MGRRPFIRPLALALAATTSASCGETAAAPTDPVLSVVLSQDQVTFSALGDEVLLTATVQNGAGEPVIVPMTWQASPADVIRVSSLGTVTALGNGAGTVTATAGGAAASASVTVSQVAETLTFVDGPEDLLVGSPVTGVRLVLADRGGAALVLATDDVSLVVTDTLGHLETTLASAPLAQGVLAVPAFTPPAARIGLVLRAEVRGIVATSGRFDVAEGPDVVRVVGTAPDRTRLLLDGFSNGGHANDVEADVGTSGPVGLFRDGLSNEVIAMAPGFVPSVIPDAGWTAGVDTVDVSLGLPEPLPVSIWLVTGLAEVEGKAILETVQATQELFRAVGAGIELAPTLHDRTSLSEDPRWQDPRTCAAAESLAEEAGRTRGALNLYVVHEAIGSARSGFVCPIGGDLVVVGRGVDGGLVAHEFGHAFGLLHVDGIDGFDLRNVMAASSGTRRELTDGQIFRMHFEVGSLLAQRQPAAHRRSCGTGASTRCPRLDLQLGGAIR